MACLVAVVALAAVGSVVAQHSYRSSSGQTRDYQYSYSGLPSPNPKNFISIGATLLSVTPETQEALVRLELAPEGSYADAEGQLRTPVTVLVRDTTGVSAYSFDAGQVMPPTDVTLDIVGQVTSYPFDTYRESGPSFFDIAVIRTGASLQDLAARVPSVVSMGSYIGGWKVNVQVITPPDVQPGKYVQSFDVHIQRASASIFYVVFIMVLMWALALAGVAMALMLTLLHRRIDAGPLTYLAALLFAFPLIRTQALPGAPALGTLTDYAAFFWTEVIVAITLVCLLVTWIIREGHADQHPVGPEA